MTIHARLSDPAMRDDGKPNFARTREWAVPGARHKLARWWGKPSDPRAWLPWILLNPSTHGDGMKNDPTLLRIIDFSNRWGFAGCLIYNVYPWRTSSPKELAKTVVGWDKRQDWGVRDDLFSHHRYVADELAHVDAAMVGWGSPYGSLGDETQLWVESLFDTINSEFGPRDRTLKLWCLGRTKSGAPIHPLARGKHRIPSDARPVPFDNPGTIELFGRTEPELESLDG